jgi:hypothetical protein
MKRGPILIFASQAESAIREIEQNLQTSLERTLSGSPFLALTIHISPNRLRALKTDHERRITVRLDPDAASYLGIPIVTDSSLADRDVVVRLESRSA